MWSTRSWCNATPSDTLRYKGHTWNSTFHTHVPYFTLHTSHFISESKLFSPHLSPPQLLASHLSTAYPFSSQRSSSELISAHLSSSLVSTLLASAQICSTPLHSFDLFSAHLNSTLLFSTLVNISPAISIFSSMWNTSRCYFVLRSFYTYTHKALTNKKPFDTAFRTYFPVLLHTSSYYKACTKYFPHLPTIYYFLP